MAHELLYTGELRKGAAFAGATGINYVLPAVEVPARARDLAARIAEKPRTAIELVKRLIAASKAVLETLCRYLHYRLRDGGTTVNVIRTRFVETESLSATFGDDFGPFVRRFEPDVLSDSDEIAEAIFGVCSGLMDALGGQVLTVDRGAGLYENFSRLFEERAIHPIAAGKKAI